MQTSRWLTLFLSSIAALTSLSIDMSLPTSPSVEHQFGLAAGKAGLMMSFFVAGYAFTPFLKAGNSTYNALYSTSTLSVAQVLRPRPEFYTINTTPMNGSANYHSLQATLNRRFTQGLSTTQSFT